MYWEAVDVYEGTVLEVFEGLYPSAVNYFAVILKNHNYIIRPSLVLA